MLGRCVEPRVNDRFDGITLGRVEHDLLGVVLEVDLGAAIVQCRERLALAWITLAEDFAKLRAGLLAGVRAANQPPVWTLASWPLSPTAITLAPACSACRRISALRRVPAMPVSSIGSTATP